MGYSKTQGLILKNQPGDEKNNFVTVYTTHFGKITYLAKGLQKNKARLKAALEPFSYSEIISSKGHYYEVITRATLIESFWSPCEKFSSQTLKFYFLDLIDRLTEEGERDPRLLTLLRGTLKSLGSLAKKDELLEPKLLLLLCYFSLKTLKFLGYLPEFSSCVACGKKLTPKNNFFSFKLGGIICSQCRPLDKRAFPVTALQIKIIRLASQKRWSYFKKIKAPLLVLKRVAWLSNFWVFYVLGKIPSSYKFIRNFFD